MVVMDRLSAYETDLLAVVVEWLCAHFEFRRLLLE